MTNILIIFYEPKTADNGDPIDVFDYLDNEFSNHGIEASMVQHEGDPDQFEKLMKELMK